jgi:hypothetical protein
LEDAELNNHIVGLVAIRLPGHINLDVLALSSPEHRFTSQLWSHSEQLCMWSIVESVALASPNLAFSDAGNSGRAHRVMWSTSIVSAERLLSLQSSDGRAISDVVDQWRELYDIIGGAPRVVHSLPGSIALLAIVDLWPCIAFPKPKKLRSSQHTLLYRDAVLMQPKPWAPSLQDRPLDKAVLDQMSAKIRGFGRVMNAMHLDDCRQVCHWVDSLHSSLLVGSARDLDKQGRPYKVLHLLNACLLSSVLRRNSELQYAIEKALELSLPHGTASVAIEHLQRICHTSQSVQPSPATISRSNLMLDVGFMLWWREKMMPKLISSDIKQSTPIYLLADSSPQGGKN